MATNVGIDSSGKWTYIQSLTVKLQQREAQLAFVKRRVRDAESAGLINVSEQLRNAEKGADSALKALNEQLQALDGADSDSWEAHKYGVDVAWDDLSMSIKKIVARFS